MLGKMLKRCLQSNNGEPIDINPIPTEPMINMGNQYDDELAQFYQEQQNIANQYQLMQAKMRVISGRIQHERDMLNHEFLANGGDPAMLARIQQAYREGSNPKR